MKKLKFWALILSAVLFLSGCGSERIWTEPVYYTSEVMETDEAFANDLSEAAIAYEQENYDYEVNGANSQWFLEAWNEGHCRVLVDHILSVPLENGGAYIIKAYIIDMSLSASLYEVYYFDGSEYTLLKTYEGLDFDLEISDGEYIYYSCDGLFYRNSLKGEEFIADLRKELPEDAEETDSGFLEPNFTSTISAEGDTITISAEYYYRIKASEWSNFTEIIEIKV